MTWHNHKGFSLVEILVTVGILTILLTGLLGLFVYCSTLSQSSENLTMAVREAQGKLEEIRDHSYSLIATDYASGGNPGNTFNLTQLNGKGVVYIDSSNSALLSIKVVVSWKNQDNRVIGEDLDLDGVLDVGEDQNANGQLDSSVGLMSMIAQR